MRRIVAIMLSSVVPFFAAAAPCSACERYYVAIFGSQTIPPNPNYSHSFAVFVRVVTPDPGAPPALATIETHTISWLPANMIVRTRALFPEPGYNFDLYTTFRYVYSNCERVSIWGPYEIEPCFYERALRQIALLQSGEVRYKADDMFRKSDRVANCIHALSSVAEGYRLRIAEPGFGETASFAITKRFEPWMIDRGQVHAWVGSAIGLDSYPIIYRDWRWPRSAGLFTGAAFRLFGGERDLQPTYGPPR